MGADDSQRWLPRTVSLFELADVKVGDFCSLSLVGDVTWVRFKLALDLYVVELFAWFVSVDQRFGLRSVVFVFVADGGVNEIGGIFCFNL